MIRFLLLLALALPVRADPLFARLAAVLTPLPAALRLPLAEVQRLDEALLAPDTLQVAWTRYPLPALRALAAYERDCAGPLAAVPAPWPQYARARCGQAPLPDGWLAANPAHPLGGSSAGRLLQRWPQAPVAAWLHVRERRDALGVLGELSDDNLDALLAGERWLLQGDTLWWQHDGAWRRYPRGQWQPLAQAAGLMVSPPGSTACSERVGTLCLAPLPASPWPWRVLLGGVLLTLLAAALWLLWQRRRLERERRFALQMLTHELRTPITGLGGVVEALRRDFDALPPSAQLSFGGLADSVARLRQLADASRHYLTADTLDAARQPWQLSQWLDELAAHHDLAYCLGRDALLLLPGYWLGLCLDNLIANARRHGAPPLRLFADWDGRRLTLALQDGGRLPRYRLSALQRRGGRGDGMGLGLTIVRRVLRRLGGRLALSGPPTTFTLRLTCDEHPAAD